MERQESGKGVIVTGVIGEDVHIVGIRILEHALRNAGFKVVPLGAQVAPKTFIESCIETAADAILISSLSGHARELTKDMRDLCREAGLDHVLLYLGGQLVIGESAWEDTEKMFKEKGFNRVYPAQVELDQVIRDLELDISTERRSR